MVETSATGTSHHAYEGTPTVGSVVTATTVVAVTTDPTVGVPSYAWWDVPVAEVSTMPEVRAARAAADEARTRQRVHLAPPDADRERHA